MINNDIIDCKKFKEALSEVFKQYASSQSDKIFNITCGENGSVRRIQIIKIEQIIQ